MKNMNHHIQEIRNAQFIYCIFIVVKYITPKIKGVFKGNQREKTDYLQ